MLINLHVKNLALIDEIDVDFSDRLNILTGETGAGKSILIDSINIALGQKVPLDMIRKGEEQAFVELTFQLEDSHTINKVLELDIPMEDKTVIISRRIKNGRSVIKVNGVSVTAAALKQIASYLIDIHGQHEHQSLLYKTKHLEILDRFSKDKIQAPMKALKEIYQTYTECCKRLEESTVPEEERLREISFLNYERQEILDAKLKQGEEEEIETLYRKMNHASVISEELSKIYQLMAGEDSVDEMVGRAMRHFSPIRSLDMPIEGLEEQLMTIEALLHDFNHEAAAYLSEIEFDPAEFTRVEQRLNIIHQTKARYGNTYDQVMEYLAQIEEKLKKYEDYDCYLAKLKEEKERLEGELQALSNEISKIRKDNAVTLERLIKEALIDLNFLDVKFEISFTLLHTYSAKGMDEVEFLISTNPGEPVKPLGKVASGGELSRIMLAIKSVLADKDEVDTLIFDEIDSGISGRTAQKVSERLATMAREHQVLAITHLPQIASMADEHYIIEKTTDGVSTHTRVQVLDEEKSILELSRMLGGVTITPSVLQNAKEMKQLATIVKEKE